MKRETAPDEQPSGFRCPRCGAAMRLSHVEYAGRGLEAAVRQCPACGEVARGAPRERQARSARRASRRARAPLDEGPPVNPVIDPETARRLLSGDQQ
ncbi:MAG TPA: hypothetical protein VF155_03335 [Candidatus Dormibacteraeota bacterium]